MLSGGNCPVERGSRASETERCEAPDSRAWSAPDMPGATAFCPVANPSGLALSRTHRTKDQTERLSGALLSGGGLLSVALGVREEHAPDICPVPWRGLSGAHALAAGREANGSIWRRASI